MKNNMKSIIQFTGMFFFILIAMLLNPVNTSASQKDIHSQLSKKEYDLAVLNFINGIKSDNAGLKKSSIYLVGLYEIPEAVKPLIKLLKSENNPDIKILIALSLYKVGNEEGFEAIKSLSEEDDNAKVKKICREICNEFTNVVNSKISQLNP